MSKSTAVPLTTPPGRLVNGSVYDKRTTDAQGRPRLIKGGPNQGKLKEDYYLAIAIPKVPGQTHWGYTEWGAKILEVGRAAFPGIADQRPDFAWKISDGDSTVPNQNNKRPCDNEGWPGHWILHWSGSYAPKACNGDGSAYLPEPGAIKRGYYVQIAGTVVGNGDNSKPGVYLNPQLVSLQGYGQEINGGMDPKAAGFGGQALPPGASASPIGGMPQQGTVPAIPAGGYAPGPAQMPQIGAMPPVMQMPGIPPQGAAPGVPSLPPMQGAPAIPPMQGVQPNPHFAANAAGSAAPPPYIPPLAQMAPPAAARIYTMTAKAQGYTKEQLNANGWTDQALLDAGMMQ